jgi:uncharacterized FlgJ-related protein
MKREHFYYDENNLKMVSIKWTDRYLHSIIGAVGIIISVIIYWVSDISHKNEMESLKYYKHYYSELKNEKDSLINIISIINQTEEFDESELVLMITGLNLLYPEVVIAQSKIETGNYTSDIFKSTGNLFGMKPARNRPYTHYGEYKGHADYLGNWRLSVIDYALWQSKEASKSSVKSVEEYLTLLKIKGYAEDNDYISKIRNIINTRKTH